MITTADLLPEVEAAVEKAPSLEDIYLSLKPDAAQALAGRYPPVDEMLGRRMTSPLEGKEEDPGLPVQTIYTSGATGNPKG